MNPDQLKAYKREKSRLFNENTRQLRLREKKRIADQQDNTIDKQDDQQPDDKQDELSLQDVMDIFETLDTKLDLIQTKLENKIDELLNRLDTIESIIETKLETKLETNTLLPQPSIFFA